MSGKRRVVATTASKPVLHHALGVKVEHGHLASQTQPSTSDEHDPLFADDHIDPVVASAGSVGGLTNTDPISSICVVGDFDSLEADRLNANVSSSASINSGNQNRCDGIKVDYGAESGRSAVSGFVEIQNVIDVDGGGDIDVVDPDVDTQNGETTGGKPHPLGDDLFDETSFGLPEHCDFAAPSTYLSYRPLSVSSELFNAVPKSESQNPQTRSCVVPVSAAVTSATSVSQVGRVPSRGENKVPNLHENESAMKHPTKSSASAAHGMDSSETASTSGVNVSRGSSVEPSVFTTKHTDLDTLKSWDFDPQSCFPSVNSMALPLALCPPPIELCGVSGTAPSDHTTPVAMLAPTDGVTLSVRMGVCHRMAAEVPSKSDGSKSCGRTGSSSNCRKMGGASGSGRRLAKFKQPPLRVTRDGKHYVEKFYTPQVHLGGRGRYSVKKPENVANQNFTVKRECDRVVLPSEVLADHCYGKVSPAPSTSSQNAFCFNEGVSCDQKLPIKIRSYRIVVSDKTRKQAVVGQPSFLSKIPGGSVNPWKAAQPPPRQKCLPAKVLSGVGTRPRRVIRTPHTVSQYPPKSSLLALGQNDKNAQNGADKQTAHIVASEDTKSLQGAKFSGVWKAERCDSNQKWRIVPVKGVSRVLSGAVEQPPAQPIKTPTFKPPPKLFIKCVQPTARQNSNFNMFTTFLLNNNQSSGGVTQKPVNATVQNATQGPLLSSAVWQSANDGNSAVIGPQRVDGNVKFDETQGTNVSIGAVPMDPADNEDEFVMVDDIEDDEFSPVSAAIKFPQSIGPECIGGSPVDAVSPNEETTDRSVESMPVHILNDDFVMTS